MSNHRGSSPERGSGDEEGISRFLESFVASEMSMEGPLTGNQRAVPPLLKPHGRRQARDRRLTSEVTVNTADATLELSQPLAQVKTPAVQGKVSIPQVITCATESVVRVARSFHVFRT